MRLQQWRRRFPLWATLRLMVMFAIAMLLEGMALGVLLLADTVDAPLWLLPVLFLHGMAAYVLWSYRYQPATFPAMGYYFPALAGLLTLALPVVGVVGSFVAMITSRVLMTPQGLAKDFEQSEFHHSDHIGEAKSEATVFLHEELSTQPIVDVLQSGDADSQRGAIELLCRLRSPEAIALLRSALSSRLPEVRFYAHTALTRLEESMTSQIEKARDEAAGGDNAALLRLAQGYRTYATSGLPEPTMMQYYMEESRNAFKLAAASEPNPETLLELALVCLEMRAYDEAQPILEELRDTSQAPRALLALCRLHFERHDYARLAPLISQMQTPLSGRDPAAALHAFWSGRITQEAQ